VRARRTVGGVMLSRRAGGAVSVVARVISAAIGACSLSWASEASLTLPIPTRNRPL